MRRGWGYLLAVVELAEVNSGEGAVLRLERRRESAAAAEQLRLALEELGPTFVKLGQILSTRADVLPSDYCVELAKLQDAGPHLPPDVVRDVVAVELGGDLESAFASFDLEPLAAASIGQAHTAKLRDGTDVVVKVRRPRAAEQAEQDLEIVQHWADLASRHWAEAAGYDLVGLAENFAYTLRAEMDYLREGRNAEQFAANFAREPDVQIPKVFWEATTSRVITLERIRGIKITDLAALDAAGLDRREIAQQATRVIAQMVFEDGIFHADPHPGNFFVGSDGRIAMIDFGMVGTLNERLREQLGKCLVALVRDDPDRLTDLLLSLGTSTRPVDRARLRDDLARLLAGRGGRRLGETAVSTVIGEILEIVRRHRMTVPRDLALLLRAFVIEEGIAVQLDPEFRLIEALTPYAHRQLAAELSPTALAERLKRVGLDLAALTLDVPDELHRILEAVAHGGIEVHLRAAEVQPLVTRAERVGNRIAASLVVAAVIDGGAKLAAADRVHIPSGRILKLSALLCGAGALRAYGARKRQRRRPVTQGV